MTNFKVGDYIRRDDEDASAVFKVTVVRVIYHGFTRDGTPVIHDATARPLVGAKDFEVHAFVNHKLKTLELRLEYSERDAARLRAEIEAERKKIQQQ